MATTWCAGALTDHLLHTLALREAYAAGTAAAQRNHGGLRYVDSQTWAMRMAAGMCVQCGEVQPCPARFDDVHQEPDLCEDCRKGG